ncbi:SusD/RagB family nutrient-binding outer membrane lipoprotein [Urechidicola vernalis]|uniref:SusD/RagB family nutrient-binding outer membrane lipoprotein n=1 Tax=Urechidicola vernalis TaxID=3075600 RepID=A0ABU2Y4Y3_9FLAO|nr:SusD/RagB family nutrient-binding outer membrane lipoprotein [Urechidicola sp. P050]MDT0553220.1 SusD/RagB family nutrient-binding outer membrane lipoprotein [Urechidicola sp. P050]
MKNLQNIAYKVLVILLVGFVVTSCEDTLEDVRENPNNVTSIDDAPLFANAARSLFNGTLDEGSYRFAGQYGHYYVAGSTARQPDQYTDGFDGNYNGIYNGMYSGVIKHIEEVLVLTSEPETENPVRHAIADVVAAMGFARITDGFGEVPYTEGGKGKTEDILTPKYDTQEFIYNDLIDRLSQSINVLKTADPAMGYPDSDPVFDNDLDRWVRMANSMRLRLAMRMRFVNPTLSQQVVALCLSEPLMEDNAHNAYMIETEGQGNAWYGRRTGFPSIKMSTMFIGQLEGTADPRLSVFVEKDGNGNYTGQKNGLNDEAFGQSDFASKSDMGIPLSSKDSKIFLMTASEIYFLRAEIALIYDNNPTDANNLYRMGIEASLEQWDIDAAEITSFLASPTATLTGSVDEQEEQLGTQMWIALTPNYYEGWTHIRRTGYPVIEQRTDPDLEKGATNGILPTRFLYSSFEMSSNGTNASEAINRQGANKIDTPIWWDKN